MAVSITTNKHYFILFIIISIFYLISRSYLVLEKKSLGYDDGISLVSASGNKVKARLEMENVENGYFSKPHSKTELESYLFNSKSTFDFYSVYIGQRNYDMHPPLYFYFLHILIVLFGCNYMVLMLFNVVIELLSMFVLSRILKVLNLSKIKVLFFVGFFVFLSPSIESVAIFRQYYLMFLLILVSTLGALKWAVSKIMSFDVLALLIVGFGFGLLSHFSFLLYIGSLGAWFLIFQRNLLNYKVLLKLAFVAIVVLVMCEGLNPEFFKILFHRTHKGASRELAGTELLQFVMAHGSFFVPGYLRHHVGQITIFAVDFALLIGAIFLSIKSTKTHKGYSLLFVTALGYLLLNVVFCYFNIFPWRVLTNERYKLASVFIIIVPVILMFEQKIVKVKWAFNLVVFVFAFKGIISLSNFKVLPSNVSGNLIVYEPTESVFSLIANARTGTNLIVTRNKSIDQIKAMAKMYYKDEQVFLCVPTGNELLKKSFAKDLKLLKSENYYTFYLLE